MEEMKDIAPIHIVVVVQLPRIAGGCSDFVGFQGIYGRTTVLIIFFWGGDWAADYLVGAMGFFLPDIGSCKHWR